MNWKDPDLKNHSLNIKKLGFIGCGNMASAIIRGLVDHGFPASHICASNPNPEKLEQLSIEAKIHTTINNQEVVEFSDNLILAVKPQVMPKVCQQIKELDLSDKLIISVAAGLTTGKITEYLNQNVSIIRAMPNTPATISKGATGLFANLCCSEEQKERAESIFKVIGVTEWVDSETLIDVVTAISGSSPAYIFLFIESMVEQAVKSGLEQSVARNLATQAVLGAAELAKSEIQTPLTQLRQNVTSPNGTTAAAIDSFEQNDFSNIIKQAVTAAIARGKELGEQA